MVKLKILVSSMYHLAISIITAAKKRIKIIPKTLSSSWPLIKEYMVKYITIAITSI